MRNEKGFSLIEVLVSLAIMSIVGVGLLSALNTSTRTAVVSDRIDTTRVLAQSQLEYVKEQPYLSSYEPYDSSTEYPGYSVVITPADAVQRNALLQKITVTVKQNGKTVTTLEGYKVKR